MSDDNLITVALLTSHLILGEKVSVYEPVQRRLQFVFRRYGVLPIENPVLNYYSMSNEVFTLKTKDGRFIIKNCLKSNTPTLLENEIAYAKHLNEHQSPCPGYVADKQGNDYVEYNGLLFVMQPFFEGDTPKWGVPIEQYHVDEAAKGLAQLHLALEDFTPPNRCDRMSTLEVDRARQWLRDLQNELEQDQSGRPALAQMRNLLPQIFARADEVESAFTADFLAECKQQYIHGDFHCYNIFYRDQQYAGCCDFDFIRHDLRLFDLYWMGQTFTRHFYTRQRYGEAMYEQGFSLDQAQQTELWFESLSRIIPIYRQYNPLSDAELKHLPLLCSANLLNVMRFFKTGNSEDECLQHAQWFAAKLEHDTTTATAIADAIERFLSHQA